MQVYSRRGGRCRCRGEGGHLGSGRGPQWRSVGSGTSRVLGVGGWLRVRDRVKVRVRDRVKVRARVRVGVRVRVRGMGRVTDRVRVIKRVRVLR